MQEDTLNKKYIDNDEEVNPYCNINVNEFERENVIAS